MSPHFIEPVWMDGKRQFKRTLRSIKRYEEPQEIYKVLIQAPIWKYRTNLEFYEKRDRAFLAFLYLSGCRANEASQLRKDQFNFSEKDFVLIKDFAISKRKERTLAGKGIPKIDIPMSKTGELASFLKVLLDYYQVAPDILFKFGTKRAWQIVKFMTGKWCHYFRSQSISHMINLIRSSDGTAKIMGIENPQTISHYYKGTWKEFKDELKK